MISQVGNSPNMMSYANFIRILKINRTRFDFVFESLVFCSLKSKLFSVFGAEIWI